jgi:class 3 adenylate cyclase/tetratricopeptide (TPR) repeat protein
MTGMTFAFTDIEGSTTRWEHDRVAMQEAVRRHDAILRAAIREHGGHVFKTIGDAFCSAFTRPDEAVAAMLAAQRQLSVENFSAVDGLRVRTAINTGTADQREGDYFGPAVNKVARLLAIGHGGQILLTAETSALVRAALPADASLRELGAYHLKDFTEPERVRQLLAPGLPADFPPLRSLGTLPSDLSIIDAAEFRSVPSFSGRDEELATLNGALKHDGAIAVVHGLGGVGKSSIAREYGWRNRDAYSVVWWLNAETEDGIIDGLLRFGTMFVQGLDQLADRRVAAQRVINSVLGGFDKPVLLVFDNLENERLMRTWLPRTGTRALATSRDAAWSAEVTAIPLRIWSLETAIAYLRRGSGRTDFSEDEARAIAEAVGALPLALAHAAASLRNARMVSPLRYLERVRAYLKNAPRGAEYPRSVFATFNTAIAQAEQHAAGAAAVLCFAASFAPDAIPDELFRQTIESYAEGLRPMLVERPAVDLRSAIIDELRLDEALGALDRLSLLTFAPSSRTYNLHRLVQLAAQDLAAGSEGAWHDCAVAVADAAFPEVGFKTWPLCERLLAHARAAVDALPSETAFSPAGHLAYRCAEYVWRRGAYSAAELLLKRALAIHEKTLGPDHPDVARSINSLAGVYYVQGHYEEAERLYRRALEVREKTLGPDHPDVSESLNDLGLLYRNQGRYDEAQSLLARALAICERALGPDHPNVAVCLDNLGIVNRDQGRFNETETLNARAVAILEKALGPHHPHVAYGLSNLGYVYGQQGRFDEAEALNTRALAIREKALGVEHPDVAISLNNLAVVYDRLGRFAEAEALYARALAIRENTFGPDHAEVAATLKHLGDSYEAQGRYEDAGPLYSRSLAIREKALGSDHPLTKAVREQLTAIRSK